MLRNKFRHFSLFIILVFPLISCTKPDDAFMVSALKNNLAGVKRAIERGANVNIRIKEGEYKGFTVLMLAAKNGNIELVKMLIKAGANVNLKKTPLIQEYPEGYNGWTALQFASLEHFEIVKLLIKAGTDVNSVDVNSRTALIRAIGPDTIKIAEFLLKSGANVNANSGEALEYASSSIGNIQLVRLLIKYGVPALIEAMRFQKIDIIKLLLDHGADVNGGSVLTQIADPGPVIIRALESAHLTIAQKITVVKLLVAYGANVNAKKEGGKSVLMVAVNERNIELIKYLIQKGANINQTDAGRATALDYITSSENNDKKAEIIQILKAAGARRGSGQPYIVIH